MCVSHADSGVQSCFRTTNIFEVHMFWEKGEMRMRMNVDDMVVLWQFEQYGNSHLRYLESQLYEMTR